MSHGAFVPLLAQAGGLDFDELKTRFFEDYYGEYVILALSVFAFLYFIKWMLKRAGSVSKYGQELPREVRVEIKNQENQGNYRAAAEILYRNESFADAAQLFMKAQSWHRAAQSYEKAGQLAKAAQYFKRAGAPNMAAELYAKRRQFKLAANEYLESDMPELAAEMFEKAKDYRAAADHYVKLEKHDKAGELLERLGDKKEAAEHYIKHFDTEYAVARGNLDNIEEAAELAKKASAILRQEGEDRRAADLMKKAGFLKEAAEAYKAIGATDEAAEIYVEAGMKVQAAKLLAAAGDKKKASLYQAEALLERGDTEGAAKFYARSGDYLKAAELFQGIDKPIDAAQMYERAGDFRAAADLYMSQDEKARAAAALERGGDSEQACELYRDLGDVKSELRVAKKTQDYFRVGRILLEHGKKEDALAALQKVDPLDPHIDQANTLQGDILRELGKLDVAYNKYKAAVGNRTPRKDNIDVFYKMARCAEEANALVQALQLYESIIGVDYYYADANDRATEIRTKLQEAGMPTTGGLTIAPQQLGAAGGTMMPQQQQSMQPNVSGAAGSLPQQQQGQAPAAQPETSKRYDIESEIARGGMGVVYKARDTVLNRVVAYKLLSDSLKDNKTAVKYFLREAQAAAAMSHPNIVTVFDAGEQEGDYYMAMEYVEGQTLKDLIGTQGAFPEKLVRYILVHTCRGLGYAHERGLVHRDIKPGNLMLTKDRVVKIMDFGLAKFVEEVRANHTQAIGTPYYMSPEQILGAELDGRSDIYSLGVTLFECATGKVPFSKGDLTYHHLHTAPPKARELNDQISERLSEIIFRCMGKKPEERFADVSELVAALKQ